MSLDIVIFGLSITSSWGNGHAATYRSLAKALHQCGHRVTFLERDVPWYRANRDMTSADYCRIALYRDLSEAALRFGALVAGADLVVLGSFVPDGTILGDWITRQARGVTAFYDIDTPVTVAGFQSGKISYMSAALVPRFDIYLSFTGGPLLRLMEEAYGSPRARVLYCAADTSAPAPHNRSPHWTLGYLGTYSADRQRHLEELLFGTARALPEQRFVVAGSQYPAALQWPANVEHIEHLPQAGHAEFYGSQRYTLNVTRDDMRRAGYSPSVRLFEAAAAGTPIISDKWPGLDTLFAPDREILLADSADQVVRFVAEIPEERRRDIAAAARQRILRSHTPLHRARQLESYYEEIAAERRLGTALDVVA